MKPASRTCRNCAHRTRAGTCGDPVAAGLAPTWGIVWASADHAKTCLAWRERGAAPKGGTDAR